MKGLGDEKGESSFQSKWCCDSGRVTDGNCDPWVIKDIHLLREELKTAFMFML